MITAKEARLATEERLKTLAKEYIVNHAEPLIREAIDLGRYYVVLDLADTKVDLPNCEEVGPTVVKLLEAQGFEAKFHVSDTGLVYEVQVTVKWGE